MLNVKSSIFSTAFVLASLSAVGPAAAGSPAWLPDKEACKYVVVKEDGTFEENGLAFLTGNNSEGAIKTGMVAGVACAGSSRLYYLVAAEWDELLKWRGGGNDIIFNIRYFDDSPGRVTIKYDSSDFRFQLGVYAPGAWRLPEDAKDGIELLGDKRWKTAAIRLPFACFTKGLRGGDIWIGPSSPAFAIAGAFLTKAKTIHVRPPVIKVVENNTMRLELDTFGVARIFDKKANKPVLEATALHESLARLTVKHPGASPVAFHDLYNAELEGIETSGSPDEPILVMRHRLACGIKLATTIKLLAEGQSEWRLAIDNPTELEVCEIRFPLISGIKLGGDADDDRQVLAKVWGQTWKPITTQRPVTRWGTSMRWTTIWDADQGLYVGIEDERLDDWGFVVGGDGEGGAVVAPCQRILAKPNATWESACYRIALTPGDWHAAADIYRAYVEKALKPTDVHPYVKWLVDSWVTMASDGMELRGWHAINEQYNNFGSPMMAGNRQMLDGADAEYCGVFPYPSPAWGSIREFQEKIALRRALGGVYTPYLNAHLFAGGYCHYKRVGSFSKLRLPGEIPIPDDEWYSKAMTYGYESEKHNPGKDTSPFAQQGMAMGSREWRDWLQYWTRRYIEWGADGMYYDQFNIIYPNGKLYPDFPDTYGCWTRAALDTITKMKAESRKVNPYYVSSGESCNDVFGQVVDVQMASGVFNRINFFTYCNPSQIVIDGYWNGGLAGGGERNRSIWQVGARFDDGSHGNLRGLKGEDAVAWFGKVIALRKAVKSLLYDARFMDTVGLTIRGPDGKGIASREYASLNTPSSGVIGRWFLFKQDGQAGAVVNLINAIDSEDGESTAALKGAMLSLHTRSFGPVKQATAWPLDGKPFMINGKQEGDVYTFTIPETELSSVVLSSNLRPVVEWLLDPVAAAGDNKVVSLKITNVNAVPLSGTAALRLPEGWNKIEPEAFGPVAAGSTVEIAMPFAIPDRGNVRGRFDVWCDVKSDAGLFSAYNLLVVNDAVLADFRGMPGDYRVWLRNLTGKEYAGTLKVNAPSPLSASAPDAFKLPPLAEINVPVTVGGQERLHEISEMTANVKVAGLNLARVHSAIPAIPNGDFETDSAGDMKPDWWMCRTKDITPAYDKICLSTNAHSGKYALLLDPGVKNNPTTAYPVHSVLKPNAKYRFSVWIKTEANNGVYVSLPGKELGNGKTNPTSIPTLVTDDSNGKEPAGGQTGPEWRKFEHEFTTGPNPMSCLRLERPIINGSSKPALFDDIVIEELK